MTNRYIAITALAVAALTTATLALDNPPPQTQGSAAFDITALAAELPADTRALIVDRRLVDRPEAGLRMFRVNRPVPRHKHVKSDEYLYVVSGRAKFRMGDEPEAVLSPGKLVFFERGTWHEVSEIIDAPFVALAFETPPRDPKDVTFFREATDSFIETQQPTDAPAR